MRGRNQATHFQVLSFGYSNQDSGAGRVDAQASGTEQRIQKQILTNTPPGFWHRYQAIQPRKHSLSAYTAWEPLDGHGGRKWTLLDLCPTPHTKINSEWITDLNIKHRTIKLLGKEVGRKSLGSGAKDFSDLTSKAWSPKGKTVSGLFHN